MTTTPRPPYAKVQERLRAALDEIEDAGLTKHERQLDTPQSAHIGVSTGSTEREQARPTRERARR